MTQSDYKKIKKEVIIDERALKELRKFPKQVQIKFQIYFRQLEKDGMLLEPIAKKLRSERNLFEVRVKHLGQWRAIYMYMNESNIIIILSAFHKKSQKTKRKEINKAKNRLQHYI